MSICCFPEDGISASPSGISWPLTNYVIPLSEARLFLTAMGLDSGYSQREMGASHFSLPQGP